MKTAVEKIIAEIDNEVDFLKTHQYVTEVRGRMIGLAFAKRVALELKEIEKEQNKQLVIATYVDLKMKNNKLPYGLEYLNKLADIEEKAGQYYNETFKQQEQCLNN
jgi:hypothetical protein